MARDNARAHVLGSIKEHLAAAHRSERPPPVLDVSRATSGRPLLPQDLSGRVARFKSMLESAGGHVTVAKDRVHAASALRRVVAKGGIRRIALSDDPVATELVGILSGVEVVELGDREQLLDCDAGLSGAQWGISETGTLVLASDAERHRLVSLLPPVHVAVLSATRILGGLEEALQQVARGGSEALPRAVTLVTGPSRTADIELTLVVGVHGPKELHVIVLQEDVA